MRISLVNMPWHPLYLPSLALSILDQVALRTVPHASVSVKYANIDWQDYVLDRTNNNIRPTLYDCIAEDILGPCTGEWIFTTALRADEPMGSGQFYEQYVTHKEECSLQTLQELRTLAPDFVAALADTIVREQTDILGLTTTFAQNIAALALAKEVKRRSPSTVVIFGGANCDGPQGAMLHRQFRFIDFVVRGEGEHSFSALLLELCAGNMAPDIPGICRRSANGDSIIDGRPSRMSVIQDVPTPDYSSFRRQFEASRVSRYVRPKAIVETSRGCWWGEKQHCTFCGLNGSTMTFRSKPAARVCEEIERACYECNSLDVITVDNIFDHRYHETLVPELSKSPYDYCIHFEIKSNLTFDQLRKLRSAKIFHLQPGIESLMSSVLRIMKKGVTGWQNVRCLRDCQALGITVAWNLLIGFPGEQWSAYELILLELPKLHHLPPPLEANRIVVQRFSPYFNNPELGFTDPVPLPPYEVIYSLPQDVLAEMVYMFSATPRGINQQQAKMIREAVDAWRTAYPTSTLRVDRVADKLFVSDTRPMAGNNSTYQIEDSLLIRVYEYFRPGRDVHGLVRSLTTDLGYEPAQYRVHDAVNELSRLGLLFISEEQMYVSLGTEIPFSDLHHDDLSQRCCGPDRDTVSTSSTAVIS